MNRCRRPFQGAKGRVEDFTGVLGRAWGAGAGHQPSREGAVWEPCCSVLLSHSLYLGSLAQSSLCVFSALVSAPESGIGER